MLNKILRLSNQRLRYGRFARLELLLTSLLSFTVLPHLLQNTYSQELPSNFSDNSVPENATIPEQQVGPQPSSSSQDNATIPEQQVGPQAPGGSTNESQRQPAGESPVRDIGRRVGSIISGVVNGVQTAGNITAPSGGGSDSLAGNIPVVPLIVIGVIAAVVVGGGAAVRSRRHHNNHGSSISNQGDDRRDYNSDVEVVTRGGIE